MMLVPVFQQRVHLISTSPLDDDSTGNDDQDNEQNQNYSDRMKPAETSTTCSVTHLVQLLLRFLLRVIVLPLNKL
jgi:hypothetical protein